MAFTLPTGITHGSESRNCDPKLHPRVDEQYNNYNSRDNRGDNDNYIRFRTKQMEWRWGDSFINFFRRNSRFRFNMEPNYTRFRFHLRSSNQSSNTGTRNARDRKNYRNFCYYYILIGLLAIGAPVRAEDETNNVSNPVAAATGNVTNQAVQFQNNGAPSRQVYGPNISCNGSTMTFSPFYMGNHTTPFDDHMEQQSYTVAENWGAQVNFMIPLDREGLKQCRRIAKRQEEKMILDYELVRAKECANLQAKGFMLVPGSRVYEMCSDVVPIVGFTKLVQEEQNKQCKPIEEFRFPWQKKRQKCPKTFQPINLTRLLNPLKFQKNNPPKPPVAP